MSTEQVWFIYHDQQQLGPFAGEQVRQLVNSNIVTSNAYLFKVGWKDWRPIEDCMEEVGAQNKAIPVVASAERLARTPRASVSGRVVIHNNGKLTIGSGVNISSSGIFVETEREMFVIGEHLKLSVRVDGIEKPFNALAEVVRYSRDVRFPVGYGLRFTEIDEDAKRAIQTLVDRVNQTNASAMNA